ncbi:MAG: hypothetical protein ACK4JE_03675 [Endomicrobiia bacterium]
MILEFDLSLWYYYKCMTGPGIGKYKLNSKVYLKNKKIPASVYIHKKGFSLARVTHLDIESEKLNSVLSGNGEFLTIKGTEYGISIPLKDIKIYCSELKDVLPDGKTTRTWVGQKIDGIYIGFRKEEILKLEKILEEK